MILLFDSISDTLRQVLILTLPLSKVTMSTVVTFSTSDQRDVVRDFIRSKINEFDTVLDLNEFIYALSNKLMPEQNLEFLDDLLGLCDFNKKYSIEVPYEKLFDYGIPKTTNTGNINQRLARSHLEENKDYTIVRIQNIPNRYTITPDAFHRLLKDARIPKSRETVFGTGDYSDFIQFILGCMNYYSEYCKIRLENDKARLEKEIARLKKDNIQETLLNITATLESIKRDTTQIAQQNVDLEDNIGYITHQNFELMDQNEDIEVKINLVGTRLDHANKQNDEMFKTLHAIPNRSIVLNISTESKMG